MNKSKRKFKIPRIKFNLKSIKGRLYGAFALVAILIVAEVLTTEIFVKKAQQSTSNIMKTQVPASILTANLRNGVNHSLAALRGWIILKDSRYRIERETCWNDEINVSVDSLFVLVDTNILENKEPLMKVKKLLKDFKKTQDRIEGQAHQDEDQPAMTLANKNLAPLFELTYKKFSGMIEEENKMGASKARKQLLGNMVDARGAFSTFFAHMQSFLLTGELMYKKKFEDSWSKVLVSLGQIREKERVLTSAQKEYLAQIEGANSDVSFFTEKIGEIMLGKDPDNPPMRSVHRLKTEAEEQVALLTLALDDLVAYQYNALLAEEQAVYTGVDRLGIFLYALLGAGLLMCALLAVTTVRKMLRPIGDLKHHVLELAQGNLEQDFVVQKNEIGEMMESVKLLADGLVNTSNFATEIGQGKFDTDFSPLSENDALGISLLQMRENLSKASEEDHKRNWGTEGLAKFAEILRENNDNLEVLSFNLISNLVDYLGANQGGLFIVNDDERERKLLLQGAYAYERQKFLDKEVFPGDGLVGQCFQEGERILLTEIPEDYIQITSGLGQATPRCILLTPIMVNDEIFGVIEVASFKILEDYEVEFVGRIGESIASTIQSVKGNIRTASLLKESERMQEDLKQQEEEMRQNLEEMTATQETMKSTEEELQKRIRDLEKQLTEKK